MYLNEKSWHVQQEDLYVIDEKIRKFLDIYALMKRKNPRKEIFVSEDEQLYIDSKNYPLAKWLSEADIEYRRLYLSFWSKRITYKPEDEYEVNVEDEILKGGTEAYLNDSFMVSIGLDEKWEQKDIKLGVEYLASWHMRFTVIPGRIFFIPQYKDDKILVCYIGKKLKNVSYPT